MASEFADKITLTRDSANEIVEVSFDRCQLRNEDDVRAFFKAMGNKIAALPEPRDLIFCLDHVELDSAARKAYGSERAALARRLYRFTARYAGLAATKVTVMTSGVLYQIDGMVYESRREAVEAIQAMRREAAKSS
jgi:hypothetical protein